jgi:protein-arginine kinase activator protein McsA
MIIATFGAMVVVIVIAFVTLKLVEMWESWKVNNGVCRDCGHPFSVRYFRLYDHARFGCNRCLTHFDVVVNEKILNNAKNWKHKNG